METDRPVTGSDRRAFLTGLALREALGPAGGQSPGRVPAAGERVCLSQRSMACDFEFFFNPGAGVEAASAALELVDRLEDQLTVYQPSSELSRLNQRAAMEAVVVETHLFSLLRRAVTISEAMEGAFDPTSGPLVALWRRCRDESRLPRSGEVEATLERVGCQLVAFDELRQAVRYSRTGVELNLGAIGKGYALDRAAERLVARGAEEFLLHAGGSSILCRGGHNGLEGWPVGLRNPLFPEQLLATLLVRNRGVSTSGNGIQFFRHQGVKYGHILDPRTGWPVDELLSVTVLAPTAAEADALSTAFFVLGVEKTRRHCHNREDLAAILIPPPSAGRRLDPVVIGMDPKDVFWASAP